MCTTIWPKGDLFIIFIYLFEFLITINSFKLNKIEKSIFGLEINHGTRVWHDKDESNGRKWALLSKLDFQ